MLTCVGGSFREERYLSPFSDLGIQLGFEVPIGLRFLLFWGLSKSTSSFQIKVFFKHLFGIHKTVPNKTTILIAKSTSERDLFIIQRFLPNNILIVNIYRGWKRLGDVHINIDMCIRTIPLSLCSLRYFDKTIDGITDFSKGFILPIFFEERKETDLHWGYKEIFLLQIILLLLELHEEPCILEIIRPSFKKS